MSIKERMNMKNPDVGCKEKMSLRLPNDKWWSVFKK